MSATFMTSLAFSSTSRIAVPIPWSSRERVDHHLGGEWRETEGRLVRDQHRGRVGEGGRERQHLLLTARQQSRDLLAPLAEDGEPRVRLVTELRIAHEHLEVLLHREPREDAARLGHEEQPGLRGRAAPAS